MYWLSDVEYLFALSVYFELQAAINRYAVYIMVSGIITSFDPNNLTTLSVLIIHNKLFFNDIRQTLA